MASYEIFPAAGRGHTRLSWLESRHSFNFGSWYRPDRQGFGLLRVLNDDVLAPGSGFDAHPHDNMEIISIPLEGSLQHRDSMGNQSIISAGEIQLMSAGTGIFHSEYNSSTQTPVRFLQLWILPFKRNLQPGYSQITINQQGMQGQFLEIVSPEKKPDCLQIMQQARIFIGRFQSGSYSLPLAPDLDFGTFIFLIQGKTRIFDEVLADRDAIGIRDCTSTEMDVLAPSLLLLMHIPLKFVPRT